MEKEIPFGAFDSELMHQEFYIPEGFEATIDGNKIILTKTESEDERIRKILINLVKNNGTSYYIDKIHKDDILAWLEKQGKEKLKKASIWKHWKDGIAGNGEGELIYLVKDGNTYSLNSCLSFECDYIELSELDNLMLEKQEEKATHINGEDYGIDGLWHAMNILEKTLGKVSGYQTDDGFLSHQCAITAVKKLYGQKSTEWSEEDETYLDHVVKAVKAHYTDYKGKENPWREELLRWLKSIKDRITWKPSEEQMAVLELASKYERVFTPKQIDILIDLKEQLKKLKE